MLAVLQTAAAAAGKGRTPSCAERMAMHGGVGVEVVVVEEVVEVMCCLMPDDGPTNDENIGPRRRTSGRVGDG